MREGTFQVESAPRHAPTIFKMRTSAIEAPHCEIELFTPARATPTLPVAEQRIIQVVPVPAYEPAPGPRPR